MRTVALALLVALLGCSPSEPPAQRAPQLAADVQPAHHSFTFPDGRLVVLEVPLQTGRRVEMQRCFLWKSERTEAFHCQTEPDALPIRLPDDPPAAADRH